MPVEKTLKAYKEEKLNCAQSVLRGFQEHCRVSEARIADAKKFGGGKAEGGLCGALHSALSLVDSEQLRNELHAAFIAQAGSVECRQIRKMERLTCGECVELAAKTLHNKTTRTN